MKKKKKQIKQKKSPIKEKLYPPSRLFLQALATNTNSKNKPYCKE